MITKKLFLICLFQKKLPISFSGQLNFDMVKQFLGFAWTFFPTPITCVLTTNTGHFFLWFCQFLQLQLTHQVADQLPHCNL